jgi:hypothetical protein
MSNREININIQIKLTSRRLAVGLAAFLVLALGYEVVSESLTMTTYYPSPSGVYRRLVSTAQTFLARDGGNVGVRTTAPAATLDVNGSLKSSSLLTGAIDTNQDSIEINSANSGNRNAYVDFHGDDTYWDYGLRMIRWNSGPNAASGIYHRGQGPLLLESQDGGHLLAYSRNGGTIQLNSQG